MFIGRLALIVVGVVLALIFLPQSLFNNYSNRLSTLDTKNSDEITNDVRFGFWHAAIDMWADYPIQGIGIGQFSTYLPIYGRDYVPPQYLDFTPHSTYFAMLSETGLVGFALFIALHVIAFRSYWHAIRNSDPETKQLAYTWFVAFLIMAFGGFTKQDNYERLLWLTLGASGYFASRRLLGRTQSHEPVPELTTESAASDF